jgi:chromosome partitioning protein
VGKIIVFANQKGGVGKTTSAVNVAAAMGARGKKTLLIDLDPQGNTSSGVGINKKNMLLSSYDVLIGRSAAESCIIETCFQNLYVMPSHISLAGAEFELVSLDKRQYRLKNALSIVKEMYDYIIIDCPPSLGILTVNALVAADSVIVPMQCEYYSMEGLSQLLSTIKTCKRLYNQSLELCGILITMYNGRLNLSSQVMDELKRFYAAKLFKTTILRNVRLSEAPSYGQPVMYYDKHCKGTEAYRDVTDEIIERMEFNQKG